MTNGSSNYYPSLVSIVLSLSSVDAFQLGLPTNNVQTPIHPTTKFDRTRSSFTSYSSPSQSLLSSSPSSKSTTSLNAFELTSPSGASILSEIDTFYQTAPYTAAFVTCGVKASAADLLAQTRSINSNEATREEIQAQAQAQVQQLSQQLQETLDETPTNKVEIQRNVAFILYGGLYQGMAQQYIYNFLFPQWFGTGQDIMTVLTKVSFDLVVVSPLVCIPIAYLVKAVIYGQSLTEGIEKYIHDLKYKQLLLTYYKIWFPAGLCSFGLVPDHLRIAFIAFISFFWLIILSTISSSSEEEVVENKAQ